MFSLTAFLMVSALLLCLGLYTITTRRNAVGILMGVELVLNAAALNFVAFAHFNGNQIAGNIFALFIIVLAAAESAVALALVVSMYRQFGTINADEATLLKG